GALLLGAAEAIRRTARAKFVHALAGVGLATLFVTVWASVAFYALVPLPVAFFANTAVMLLGVGLAFPHRGEAILVLALIAGFANPVVLSTGEAGLVGLFAYLALITTASMLVARRLGFKVVPWLAMAGTAVLLGGWYAKHFVAGAPAEHVLPLATL